MYWRNFDIKKNFLKILFLYLNKRKLFYLPYSFENVNEDKTYSFDELLERFSLYNLEGDKI